MVMTRVRRGQAGESTMTGQIGSSVKLHTVLDQLPVSAFVPAGLFAYNFSLQYVFTAA